MAAGPRLFSLGPDAAWAEAVKMRQRSDGLSPGLFKSIVTELDSKGKAVSVEEQLSRITYGDDGKASMEILSATSDGKDVTEKRKEESKKRQKGEGQSFPGMGGFEFPDPLKPSDKAKITIGPAKTVEKGGRKAYEYPFQYSKPMTMGMAGVIVLDAENGKPLSMDYSMKPLPPGVKYADFSVHYSAFGEDAFVTDSMKVGFDANLIVFKKRMEFLVELKDYAKSPVMASPSK